MIAPGYEWQVRALANAADQVAEEINERVIEHAGDIAPGDFEVTLDDISVSYARGVQDVLQLLLGDYNSIGEGPDELRVIYSRFLESV